MYFEIESSLIEKAAAGDMSSFEKIVALCEKSIYNICYRYFNNEEDAKDITQEAFIKIYRNLGKYNFKSKFSTWAYRITVNSCIDQLRKKNSRPQPDELAENDYANMSHNPESAIITQEALKNIEESISKLSPDDKTVIILRDINGLSYQDISNITGLNIGTVKSRISRSRMRLKQILINDYNIRHI